MGSASAASYHSCKRRLTRVKPQPNGCNSRLRCPSRTDVRSLASIWESKLPFIPAANVVQVTINQVYGSQPCANVVSVQCAVDPAPSLMADLGDIFIEWLGASYAALKHLGWSVSDLRLRDLTVEGGEVLEVPVTGIVGSLAGTPLPSSIAMCLSLRSSLAGRTRRGRFYSTGHTAAQLENTNQNMFTATAINAHIASLQALDAALTSGGFQWCVVSRQFLGAPRVTAQVTAITSIISTDPTVDSQRGRTRS